jgi:hypothetical protein
LLTSAGTVFVSLVRAVAAPSVTILSDLSIVSQLVAVVSVVLTVVVSVA